MQFCPLPSSTILTVIIKTAVSWVLVTSFDNRLFNALDPEGCVTPYNSSKSDLRFQRALRVAEHHPNRNWHKLRPIAQRRQGQVAQAFKKELTTPAAALSLSRTSPGTHRASYARPAPCLRPTSARAARLAPGARGGRARPRDAARPGALAAPSRPRHVPVSRSQGARASRRPSVTQPQPHLRRHPSGCRAGRPPTACHGPDGRAAPRAGAEPGRAARGGWVRLAEAQPPT